MNRTDKDDTFLSLLSSQRSLLMQIQQENDVTQQATQQATPMHYPQQVSNIIPYVVSHYPPKFPGNPPSSIAGIPSHHHSNMSGFQLASNHPSDSHEHSFSNESLDEFSLEPTPFWMRRSSLASDSSNGFFGDLMPNRLIEKLSPINEQTHNSADEMTRIRASSPFDTGNHSSDSLQDMFKVPKPSHRRIRKREVSLKANRNQDFEPAARPSRIFDISNHSSDSLQDMLKEPKPRHRRIQKREVSSKVDRNHDSEPAARPRRKGTDKEEIQPTSYTDSKVQRFADALEKSAESQQEIHKWDRKMGLKRSHSKTMTMSMQSRKKLKYILKNLSAASKGSSLRMRMGSMSVAVNPT
jgi:hypothetical protein